MQQLYRFAELCQLSAALLHDLANHLTLLTIDIEDLHRQQHPRAINRAKATIEYLDKMVAQVRTQLQGSATTELFSPVAVIQDTVHSLQSKIKSAGVAVKLNMPKHYKRLQILGDPTRFQQICSVIISNAVDAYIVRKDSSYRKQIEVNILALPSELQVKVRDWGSGISRRQRRYLFKPFHSTKKDGMGIGLFIARQIIETHFKGSIALTDTDKCTEFVLTFQRTHEATNARREANQQRAVDLLKNISANKPDAHA